MINRIYISRLVFLLLAILSSSQLSAQTAMDSLLDRTIEIRGNISDVVTQEPIPDVKLTVRPLFFEAVEAKSDSAGNYSMIVPISRYETRLRIDPDFPDTSRNPERILLGNAVVINQSGQVYTAHFIRCPLEIAGRDTEDDRLGPIHIGDSETKVEKARNSPHILPAFPGGNEKLRSFLIDKIHYTDRMREFMIKGEVTAGFLIDAEGKMADIRIFRDLGAGSGMEVINAFEAFPRWKPYEVNGRKIPYFIVLSVNYDYE